MEERFISVEIKGIVPLLQHRYPDEDGEKKSTRAVGAHTEKSIDEATKALYRLPDGKCYIPASHIEGALMKAASNFQIAGKRKKTFKDLVKSSIFVEPEALILSNQKWTIDKRAVVVPATRGRVIRCRPRFDEWGTSFKIRVTDDSFPTETLKEILDYAGKAVGIGDFRPRYGRFIVTKFKE